MRTHGDSQLFYKKDPSMLAQILPPIHNSHPFLPTTFFPPFNTTALLTGNNVPGGYIRGYSPLIALGPTRSTKTHQSYGHWHGANLGFDLLAPYQKNSSLVRCPSGKQGRVWWIASLWQTSQQTNGGLSDPLQPPNDNTQCDDVKREENLWTLAKSHHQLQFL